ncbi:hypothetical protein [Methanobrevibacter woesei]|uniref:hypothetical protein n=1 Tax=Methanobrevibacter woesei TaxID=190976 RepID=UPI002354A886|nr:hypothetical protein [Methanobrevibacter woesei]
MPSNFKDMFIGIFIENSISLLFNALLPILVPLIYSCIKEISFHELLLSLPTYIYIILILPFIIQIIIKYIKSKMEEGKVMHIYGDSNYKKIGYFPFKDMCWEIRGPQMLNMSKEKFISNIDVYDIPRCMECGTKLELVEHNLWYSWKCVNCSFTKRTWYSHDKLISHVQKLSERSLELYLKENNK